jgi:hypothetical protein
MSGKEIFQIINETGEAIQVDMSTPSAKCPSPLILQPEETFSVMEYHEPIIVAFRGAYKDVE